MPPEKNFDCAVLIVGGGSVGLSLACELGRLGVDTLLVEAGDGTLTHPRASELNARTMEITRRWGVAGDIRAAGIPRDFPNASLFCTSLTGYALAHIKRPWHGEERDFPLGPERPKRCNQIWFNPIVRARAEAYDTVRLCMDTRLESFEQDADGVGATVHDRAADALRRLRARYLVACCGGNSAVPAALGQIPGPDSVLDHSLNIFFRAPGLGSRYDNPTCSLNFFVDETGVWGSNATQDGRELWRLTVHGADAAIERADPDACLRRMFGGPFDYEIINVVPWTRRSWVASSYGEGRVFLAGDAVHLCSPTGGLGLNTGMGDADNLAWKLKAAIDGWAGPALLASYDSERRPVGHRNIAEATDNFHRYTLPDTTGITAPGIAGEALRQRIGKLIADTRARIFLSDGIALGTRYEGSPVIWPDGTAAPDDPVSTYTPTARPGHRAPHAWIADRTSTLDLFGHGFTLLRLGRTAPECAALTDAAQHQNVPLSARHIADDAVRDLYGAPLVLVRPDGHVAWRGDADPADAAAVIATVRGAG